MKLSLIIYRLFYKNVYSRKYSLECTASPHLTWASTWLSSVVKCCCAVQEKARRREERQDYDEKKKHAIPEKMVSGLVVGNKAFQVIHFVNTRLFQENILVRHICKK